MSETKRITKAAGKIGLATLTSRILGLIRDMVVARLGAGLATDAFYVAYRIPNLLRELLAEGSMSAGFIPVFTEYWTTRSKQEAWDLACKVFTILLGILLIVCTLGIIFSPWIVPLIAPGFTHEGGKLDLTIDLTRIMFPYLLFIGLAALVMGVLNSIRLFGIPALAPAVDNLVIIISIFIFTWFLKDPIVGIAIAVTLGGLVQFLFQLPALYKSGMPFRLNFQVRDSGVKKVFTLILPSLLGLSVAQINLLVNTHLASRLAEGSVTYLYYGIRLIHFPLGIFAIAVATAILPSLSASAAKKDIEGLKESFSFGLRLVFFIAFPATIGLVFLRVPIVQILFQHGDFTFAATQGTATAVFYYALGLWAFAGVRIVVPVFYALQDTKTPVKIAVASLFANILFSLILMGPLQHGGLALATSLASVLNMGLLVWILRKKIGNLGFRKILQSHLKVIFSSIGIAVICYWVNDMGIWLMKDETFEKLFYAGTAIFTSVASYFALHFWMKGEELQFIWKMLKRDKA
ncbi:MAG: murein biosynthesis integral membrane protein MurJ [Nitrospirae bacterium]|nr:murein biosynthesis integral membrane protein MurJ [Nitrospirota bacterium]MBI3352161.1 murein biosynthesis integral membrane protein MurJ [Nitrospirota bacterium]